jgi:PIN domain nuclease of toxin-antitoxin system
MTCTNRGGVGFGTGSRLEIMWIYATGEKCGLRPERIPVSGIEFLHFCEQAGYEMLPIRERHVIALESLPTAHADPFDRILISQARAEA